MAGPDIDELTNKYLGTSPVETSPTRSTGSDVQSLFDKYSSDSQSNTADVAASAPSPSTAQTIVGGVKQGANDVLNSVGQGIGFIDRHVSQALKRLGYDDTEGEKRSEAFNKRVEQENKDFQQNYGDTTTANLSRLGGQVLTTAPLTPVRAVQAINVGMKATPVITAAGTKLAAPLINRLGASVVTGGLAGGEYGALTSASNDKSLAENVGEGLITGALAGPVLTAAGTVANKLVGATKDLWANIRVNQIVNKTGMPASAVKNIIGSLENAGFTPQTAQAELDRLGPGATLADLDKSLTGEAGALSKLGGKPTAILKGRFEDRANTAIDETKNIVDSKLGPKPDIEAEKDAIINQARKETAPDYKAAHASTDELDAKPIADDINKQLETAVGSKQSKLKEANGYLFRTVKDAEGNETSVLKNSVADLHEVRIGLDEMLGRLPAEGSSQKSATFGAIKDIRSKVDELLKQNPQMQAADEKYAAHMDRIAGLKIGHDAIAKSMTKEQFAKIYDNAEPEVKDTIRKGMRAAIGDYMEGSQQGEATAAQRLFSKKSVNQANVKRAYGVNAQEALNALEKQEAFRGTEKRIMSGSDTAENLIYQKKYGGETASSALSDTAKGLAYDVMGGHGAASVIMAGKRLGGNALIKLSENKLNALAEGSADILSRTGNEAKNALGVMERVQGVQNAIAKARKARLALPNLRLPVALSAPSAENFYERNK